MAEKSTFFQTTLTFVTDTFGDGMLDKVGNFITGIAPIFEICFGIFLLLWVFHFWVNGSFTEMGIDFVKKFIAWFFIIALAVNAAQYMKVAKMIYNLDVEVVGLYSGKPYDGNTLDVVMDEFNEIDEYLWKDFKKMDWMDKIGWAFTYGSNSLCLHLFGGIFLIVCFASYLMHKLLLVLSLLVGPLFIGLGLFSNTRNYMLNWINQCAGLILTTVFIGLVGEFQIVYLNKIKPTTAGGVLMDISEVALFNSSLILGTILFSVVIWNIPNLANALTGGGASAGGLSFAKGMASGGVSGAAAGYKGAKAGLGKAWNFMRRKSSATPT